MLLWIFFLLMIAGAVVFLWKKGYLKKLTTPEAKLKEGMRILWCEKEKDEVKESIVTESSNSGKYIRLDGKNEWTTRAEITVLEVLPVTHSEAKPIMRKQVK